MNAYYCHLEGRTYGLSYDPPDPGEYGVPCGIYIADTRGQAKLMLLDEFWRSTERDEFIDVRTSLLERDITDCEWGPLEAQADRHPDGWPPYGRLWGRVAVVEATMARCGTTSGSAALPDPESGSAPSSDSAGRGHP